MAIKLQMQQHHGKRIGRQAATANEIIETAGIETHDGKQIMLSRRGVGTFPSWRGSRGDVAPAQLFQDVLRGLHKLCAMLDQCEAAARLW